LKHVLVPAAAAALALVAVSAAAARPTIETVRPKPWLQQLPAVVAPERVRATPRGRRAGRPGGRHGHVRRHARGRHVPVRHGHVRHGHGRRHLHPRRHVHVGRRAGARFVPRATISLYEHTTKQWVLRRQGCRAARRGVGGIVILDFGKPSYNGHTYGTILFSDRFAGNREITRALLAYAVGYRRCLPRGSHARIVLARGTSNYHPSVPSAFKAGRKWARETNALARLLAARGLAGHVSSAAADDAEPAWDPSFHKTRDFFRGYRAAGNGRPLYNYGSLDGGVGAIWNERQAFYVTGGMRYARPIPEIYNRAMARQWAHLAWVARRRFHRRIRFAGVMTQHVKGCNCGYLPPRAHAALVRELAARRVPHGLPRVITNIRSAR
jgi:hypothetical protein